MPDPPVVVLKLGVAGQIHATDPFHQAPEDTVAIARDQRVLAVIAAVGIARSDARQTAASRLADSIEYRILGNQAFHHVEH